jgi:hypothetical protein
MKKLLILSTFLLSTNVALAQKDSLPSGKPFQELAEQITATNNAIEATNSALSASDGNHPFYN